MPLSKCDGSLARLVDPSKRNYTTYEIASPAACFFCYLDRGTVSS